jgi:hypothetical protein
METPPPDLPRCLALANRGRAATPPPSTLGGGGGGGGGGGSSSLVSFSGSPPSLPPPHGAASSLASKASTPRARSSNNTSGSASPSSFASVGVVTAEEAEGGSEGGQQQQQQQRAVTPPPPPASGLPQSQSSCYVPSPLRVERSRSPTPHDGSNAVGPLSSIPSASSWSFYSSGAAYHPHSQSGLGGDRDPWGWAPLLDELSRSLRDRLVFDGFREGPLRFPMSYRWKRVAPAEYVGGRYQAGRGGLAEDFSDEGALQAAYSTFVPAKPSLFSALSLARAASISSDARTGAALAPSPPMGPAQPAAPVALSKSQSSIGGTPRTPSWTDRVLSHSLPGKAPFLRWRAYDMADDVGLSDHRPVASHLTLLVDADCPPPATSSSSSPSPSSPSLEQSGTGDHGLAHFSITIPKPPVVTLRRGSVSLASSSEISILYPLTGEDPIAEQRKASSLGEVGASVWHVIAFV